MHIRACPDIPEQFRSPLDFVKNDRAAETIKESTRILGSACCNIRVFKKDIFGFLKQMSEKPSFARPPRSCQHDCREACGSGA